MNRMLSPAFPIQRLLLCCLIAFGSLVFSSLLSSTAEGESAAVRSDAETAGELNLLLGEGNGLTAEYLAKSSTRLQAAIISLRLSGTLQEALAYSGNNQFADADQVNEANQAVLAYLKDHPERGWQGIGANRFEPLAPITSQQLYKVLLENLGFRSGTDFAYADTESFAASKGLAQISGTTDVTNAHIATALIESLRAQTASGDAFFAQLQADNVIPASAALAEGSRITVAHNPDVGDYFTDGEGRTLYWFANNETDLQACQEQCLVNWPVFHAESLTIPAFLDAADFGSFVRDDGVEQTTYKGWPLYYFLRDAAPGDIAGEGVGGIWFVAGGDLEARAGDEATPAGNSSILVAHNPDVGDYFTDGEGRTLYWFANDATDMQACKGQCLVNWPVFHAESPTIPASLDAADFGSFVRDDGVEQTTYKGWPLYYFLGDTAPGDVAGEGVGGVWFVASGDLEARAGDEEQPDEPGSGSAAPDAKTYHVDIKQYSFGSGPLTVEAGSTIIFTNFDDMEHNAVAVNGAFSAPLLAKGESYTITLDEPGTYDYYCEPHREFMTGTIIVQ